jgi:GNAT superfamily N-acetyltransferase
VPIDTRLLRRSDIPAAVRLLQELNTMLAGVQNARVYRGVLQDAAAGRGPIVHVAIDGTRAAGVSIAVPAAKAYWKAFAMRRPWLAVAIALERRRRNSHGEVTPDGCEHAGDLATMHRLVTGTKPPFSWNDPPANSARLLYFGVSPDYRGRGIGMELLNALASDAALHGFAVLDSSIDKTNVPSMRTHLKAGWQLFEEDAHVYGLRAPHQPLSW